MSKIVIDARIIGTSTGIYAENLINQLEKIDDSNEYVVLLSTKSMGKWHPKKANFSVQECRYKDYSFGEQLGLVLLLRSLKPDLVHFCMPQQPLLYFGKRITTVHDLTLVRFENIDMNPIVYKIRKLIFTGLLHNVISRSKAIITPTDFVRKDVLDFTSKSYSKKVIKTLEAGEPLAAHTEPIEKFKDARFITFIGNAFPYKNLHTIVDAFALLYSKYPDLQLVFAGKKDIFYEQLAEYAEEKGVHQRTHILGFVSEGEKRWLLQNAESYIVASLSEGFHIPGLEAMYEECPVISSSATCLPEVYEEAALYFDPHHPMELARHIEDVMNNKPLRKKLIKAGNKQVRKYSWEKMAHETHDVYMRVLKET